MKKRYLITLRGDNPIKERQMAVTALQLSVIVDAFADTVDAKELIHPEVTFHVETLGERLDRTEGKS